MIRSFWRAGRSAAASAVSVGASAVEYASGRGGKATAESPLSTFRTPVAPAEQPRGFSVLSTNSRVRHQTCSFQVHAEGSVGKVYMLSMHVLHRLYLLALVLVGLGTLLGKIGMLCKSQASAWRDLRIAWAWARAHGP